jgi:predicted aspartyl protease
MRFIPGREFACQRSTWYRPGLRAVLMMAGGLLALGTALGVSGCAPQLTGSSGALAWEVTDLRVVERSVAGTARDLYTFTLVLQETQGSAVTFTHLEQTVSQPSVNAVGEARHSSMLWKLRPHGELRQPFSFYWYCATGDCPNRQFIAPAPWYNIRLTGTDARGQSVQVEIDVKLPGNPPGPKVGPSLAMSSGTSPTPGMATGQGSGSVPFRNVLNHIWIHAVLNQKEQDTLLLDTGAAQTLITPDTAQRLGISPAPNAPKRPLTVVGGHRVEIPFVQLSTIAVGEAVVEHLQAGVVASFPHAPLADGILGEDFLKHFMVTFNYTTSRLWLEPTGALPALLSTTAPHQERVYGPIPLRVVKNHLFVRALLHQKEPVTLLLDTGASYTMLTPHIAQQLGISPPAHAPRKTLSKADGQQYDAPFVQCEAIAVGEAVVQNLPVGIYEVLPDAPAVSGILGVDFLEHFTVTLDHATRRLWLVSPQAAPS